MTFCARSFAFLFGLAAVAFANSAALAQEHEIASILIQKSVQANVQEFFDMLALPDDSVNAEDIRKNADWLETAFRKRGFVTRQLANNGKPLVFAEYSHHALDAKTILFYMHFDGQPVLPDQWAQKSPWIAVLKERSTNGKWEEIDRDKLKGEKIDLDWRIFARAASDDKGPIMMFLTAFDRSQQQASTRL
jgi:acetylornithine deacetylase/succinyl-diaminopimelate desuccinylase-like protein